MGIPFRGRSLVLGQYIGVSFSWETRYPSISSIRPVYVRVYFEILIR